MKTHSRIAASAAPTPNRPRRSDPAPPPTSVSVALEALKRSVASTHAVRLELPEGFAPRMRNLVHRGTQRPVFKVPSVKLSRTVQCESILEYETALLLDVLPQVTSFAEQPARVNYVFDGISRSHIPDFAVVAGTRKTFLEIKFEKDVDPEVVERTKLMEQALKPLDWGYLLLTERQIRCGAAVQNATSILRRARHSSCEVLLLSTLEKLRRSPNSILGDHGWATNGDPRACAIARLIIQGQAEVDITNLVTEASAVWACAKVARQEGATWLLAPSE